MEHSDYRAYVSERMKELILRGKAPWQRTWAAGAASSHLDFPLNAVTGRAYRGGNALYMMAHALWIGSSDPRWCTFKQARDSGWRVAPAATSVNIEFWKTHDDDNHPLSEPEAFYAKVFNASGLVDIPDHVSRPFPEGWNPAIEAERIMDGSGAVFVHDLNDRRREQAFYAPSTDRIHLHPKEAFSDHLEYYEEALHELCHWSGHRTRMNRPLNAAFGSLGYAREELRAQIASLYVSIELGLPFRAERHVAYHDHWAKLLSEEKHEFFHAAKDAEEIAAFVMELALERKQEKSRDAGAQEPVQPVILSNEQMFEHRRSEVSEGGYSSHIKAFGGFAGAIGEDALAVYGRWSMNAEVKGLIETGSAKDVISAMQRSIETGVPQHALSLLVSHDRPGEGATLDDAFAWSERVERNIGSIDEYLSAHEMSIFDAERVGADEAVLAQARSDVYELRKSVAALRDEPDALLKRLQADIQRQHELRFDGRGLDSFSKKPKVSTLENWATSVYEGKLVHLNPRMIDLGGTEPHLKGWDKRTSKDRPVISEVATVKVVNSSLAVVDPKKLELIASFQSDDKRSFAAFKRTEDEPAVYAEVHYVQYFLSKYPGADIFSGPVFDQSSALQVRQGEKLVGIFMCVRMDMRDSAAEIQQYVQRNELEHSAKPEGPVHVPLDMALLRAKPTPASIQGWMRGEVAGKLVYLTQEVMDMSGDEPAIKDWEKRVNAERPEVGSLTCDIAVRRAELPGMKAVTPIAMLLGESARPLVAFARNSSDPCVYVDSAYVRYFQHQHADVEYRLGDMLKDKKRSDQYAPLQVWADGALVGIMAPITVKDRARTPDQVKELLAGKPVIVPTAAVLTEALDAKKLPTQKVADHVNGFTKGMPPVGANRVKKALGKEVLVEGLLDTVRSHVERWHAHGDLVTASLQRPKVPPMSHAAFNAASHAERREHEAKMKKGGKENVFLVNNHDLGKVAHDYAVHLGNFKALEMGAKARPPSWDEVAAMAEIARDTGDPEVLGEFSRSFGVGAGEFLGMSEAEQRQHLWNHAPVNAITSPAAAEAVPVEIKSEAARQREDSPSLSM